MKAESLYLKSSFVTRPLYLPVLLISARGGGPTQLPQLSERSQLVDLHSLLPKLNPGEYLPRTRFLPRNFGAVSLISEGIWGFMFMMNTPPDETARGQVRGHGKGVNERRIASDADVMTIPRLTGRGQVGLA